MENNRVFVRQSISLSPDHKEAVDRLAANDGHRIASRVIQKLIDREMERRYGPDWRDCFRPDTLDRANDDIAAEAVAR